MLGNATNGTRSYSANGLNQYTAPAGASLGYDANANLTGDGTWTYGYDLNKRDSVQSVLRAVGSAVAQTYPTYSYTNNGLVATLRDANNNLTSYQYDGHDRKVQTSYPDPTTVNTSSSTDYEQYGFDANAICRKCMGPKCRPL